MFLVYSPLASTFRWISVLSFLSSFHRMSWCLRLGFRCCHLLFFFWDYQWQLVLLFVWTLVFHILRLHYSFSSRCSFSFPSFEGLVPLLQSDFQHVACCRIHRWHLQYLFLMWLSRLCLFHFRDKRSFPSRFCAWKTFDASEFLQNPLYTFLSFCSSSISDAFFDPLAQFFQLVFVSFRGVSPLLNESSDIIVCSPGFCFFIFLRHPHNFSSLCFFFGCCCVCIFTRIACYCCMCVFTQILCCCVECCCGVHVGIQCGGPQNKSPTRVVELGGCGVCVFIRMECCCGFRNKSSIRIFVPLR